MESSKFTIVLKHLCLKGTFYENYRNLSYKSIFGTYWAAHFCEQADFVIKADDDIFIDMFATYYYTRYIFLFRVDDDIFFIYVCAISLYYLCT